MTLLDQVEAFLVQWNMPPTRFGTLAIAAPNLVERMRHGRTPRARTEASIRNFMATYSPEAPGQRLSVRDQVRVEAEHAFAARERARRLSGTAMAGIEARRDAFTSVMEVAGPQSPSEAIRLVQQRWPETWSRIVAEARATRQTPGVLMIALIEQGLSA